MEIPLDAFHASAPAPARVAAHDEPREAKRAIAAVPLMSACPPDVFPARDRPLRAPGLPLGASRPKTRERVSRVFRAGVMLLRFAARSPPADETPRSVTPESVFLILTRLLSPSEFRRGHGYLRRRKRSRAHGRLPRGPRRGRAPRDRRDVRRVGAGIKTPAPPAPIRSPLCARVRAAAPAAVAAAAARGGAAHVRATIFAATAAKKAPVSLFFAAEYAAFLVAKDAKAAKAAKAAARRKSEARRRRRIQN